MSFFKQELVVEDEPQAFDPEPELEEPDTDGSESMEEVYDAEDSTAATVEVQTQPKRPAGKRRQGVSRMFVEAVAQNPGLTQSEYQRVLGLKSPIATMAKRLIERGIIRQQQDGKFVRYYPGTTPYTEVRAGRKPNAEGNGKAKRKPSQPKPAAKKEKQEQRYNIITVTDSSGNTERFMRLDGVWYNLIKRDKPLF
jgi:hypothetical protein